MKKLIEMEEYDSLQDLVLAGYDKFGVLDKFQEQANVPEDIQIFLNELPELRV